MPFGDKTGPASSGFLELVGFPRIDKRLEKYPAYREAKAANGGLDPFGPAGQPHFELDFVLVIHKVFTHVLGVAIDVKVKLYEDGEPYIVRSENDMIVLAVCVQHSS